MRNFWSIYLLTAAAGTVAVYHWAPMARPYIPESLKTLLSTFTPEPAVQPETPLLSPIPVAPTTTAKEEDDEMPPAMHGIFLARRGQEATWGITRQRASYYKLDGTRVGNVDSGVLFDFQSKRSSSKGDMVVCVLHGDNIPATPFLIGQPDILLFTGDRSKLSASQISDLKAYYSFSGQIAQRRKELLAASAQKNPFFEPYQAKYKTLMAHVEKAKALTAQRDKATDMQRMRISDQLHEMKQSEAKLRREYDEIHQKFKAWKDQHAGDQAKPDDDPFIKQWTGQRNALISRIPGLAY